MENKIKDVAEKAKEVKQKIYKVCVTGFFSKGKMFSANDKVDSKIYKDYIQGWLSKGYIK